jgi:carbon starvation protein
MFNISPASAVKLWDFLILAYCFVASILPMWMLLQPRGHLGGYFLYAAILASSIGVLFGDFSVQYPAFTQLGSDWGSFFSPMFPILFITIACGACSGFHSLVGSGTTSKQLKREGDSKIIGYGTMLIEGLVAVVALACVMMLATDNPQIGKPPNFIYALGIGRFLELVHIPAALGISFGLMAFTTFVYDTLDVSTRLGRYIIEELTGWGNFAGKAFATAVTAGVPMVFVMRTTLDASGNPVPAWRVFWNVFGASNQLLAALALIGITVWLFKTVKKRYVWMAAFFPALWMFTVSTWALCRLIADAWFMEGRFAMTSDPVIYAAAILVALAVMMAVETVMALARDQSLPRRIEQEEQRQKAELKKIC